MENVVGPGAQLLPVLGQLVGLLRQVDTHDDLSLVAASVLGRLARDGAQRLTDLARSERGSQPGMTQLVGRLERAGLVCRLPDPTDGRGVLVQVTDGGSALVARHQTEYAAALDRLLGELDPDDRSAIATALPALSRLALTADRTADRNGAIQAGAR